MAETLSCSHTSSTKTYNARISLSLSVYIYIYTHAHTCLHTPSQRSCFPGTSAVPLFTFVYGPLTGSRESLNSAWATIPGLNWSVLLWQCVLCPLFYPLTSLRIMASGVINSSVISSTRLSYKMTFQIRGNETRKVRNIRSWESESGQNCVFLCQT
jgi:hypothetical protein